MSDAYKYRSCFMSDLAKRAGQNVTTFQDWFTESDWVELVRLGWRPNRRKLTTPVVRYITDKYLPDYARDATPER